MALSAFDLFSVGIGPSSSHTVGPMRAAKRFVDGLAGDGLLAAVRRVRVELFGSLGATGHGHGSPKAVVLGLEGEDPATVDTDSADARVARAADDGVLLLAGKHQVAYDAAADVVLHRRKSLPAHPNGMVFRAFDGAGSVVAERTYYSVGGGFVVDESATGVDRIVPDDTPVRYPFITGAGLLDICAREGLRISDVMMANELSWRTEAEVRAGLLRLWRVMAECVENGCHRDGVLPGGLRVPRRAPALYRELTSDHAGGDPMRVMDWVNLFALAVNEENASGGRIVTAPTNGAAGIVPAVLHYYARFVPGADDDGIVRFLLTAAAIGILFKENASISGAEVGCQGEVGSACSMAAGGLCEVLGGTPAQVENAAEVGIEHNLGLTCDPVGGLVQIPCIERNAIASVKAINAARLARFGDGSHKVSLDRAIKTMRDTGRDMSTKYKETARGGLAVNVIEC
ncbi:L-serine ammonia-lyase [Planosporangium thailandense]|uniref:L-serine dehydratase n=1 Tax=Planosporangium thailandense TaxID=765197 RepID=A0ABX0XZV9_9ACTN|nr:L-serine ammonia-lyase [Planosporangium thailandense]NJC71328.1 L-serine ammonia-lyase [Planosporangium thailandense]